MATTCARALKLRAADAELADRTAAPDRDGVAVLDIGELRALPAGGENVGKKQHLFVGQAIRHLGGQTSAKGTRTYCA